MAVTLPEYPVISVGDMELFAIDFTDLLDAGETLTSPTVAEVTSTDLTISNVAVNVAAITVKGVSVAIGCGLQWKVTGQKVNTTYTLLATVTTTSTPARTLKRNVRFGVE